MTADISNINKIETLLNTGTKDSRLTALKQIKECVDSGEIRRGEVSNDTNNHVHSFYSFSPYSPTMIVYKAYIAGLSTIGLMDHDSVAGVEEFIQAGIILGIPTTVGVEVRMNFVGTRLEGRQLDYIEQKGIGYNTIHGLPLSALKKIEPTLTEIREKRNKRNRAQTERLNELITPFGLNINFDKDVYPISKAAEGGSITDRHILHALAKIFIAKYGKGEKLIQFLQDDVKINLDDKVINMLNDVDFYAYEYDVINILKSYYTTRFLLPCDEDTLNVKDAIALFTEVGGIPCRCYLGDVLESPTGDKKAMKAEDDFLELFMEESKALGFASIAFMPTRNSIEQLKRVMKLCDEYELMQVSGEDINQPRQSFITEKLRLPEFTHLESTTWAVIGSERLAQKDVELSIVSRQTKEKYPQLSDRVAYFEGVGRKEL